uniref:Uncharacterized low-complexity proteins-like protein n=1 Tax=Chlorobium chlorochromatii (strain CaD3) TaxID=340177 RepID=Q3AR89_CHLCH
MTTPDPQVKPSTLPNDPLTLLEVANHSSERLAVQHTAFIAACVYVLIIVFGTTDLDLLIGKGVRLPFVDVEVPIVGFFAFVPFILVLVHFNLLLQLQLLSRKLFAFDATVPQDDGIGGLRDRLHIFAFTYYLAGNPSRLVKPFLAIMVSITLVLLPLFVLFAMQLQFLAYQDEVITWMQRFALWLDIALINIFLPTMLHPKDDWKSYWRNVIACYVPHRRVWLSFLLLYVGTNICLFASKKEILLIGIALLVLSLLLLPILRGWKATHKVQKIIIPILIIVTFAIIALLFLVEVRDWIEITITSFISTETIREKVFPLSFILYALIIVLTVLWQQSAPRGSFALVVTLFLGTLFPLAFMVDGEHLEKIIAKGENATFLSNVLQDKRRLNLSEQHLFAKALKPEIITLISDGKWKEALPQIEPINLQGRHLRHAELNQAMLLGADLRFADLQGAYLSDADLQGAYLSDADLQGAHLRQAELQGAHLRQANLQGAYLRQADLQDANLSYTNLQGADFIGADLQGADLRFAHLQGANLFGAHLQGAYLFVAHLQGAYLSGAHLQGADLSAAHLQGADLFGANLYAADIRRANTTLVDAQNIRLEPLSEKEATELRTTLKPLIKDNEDYNEVAERIKKATAPHGEIPYFESILAEKNTPLRYKKCYNAENSAERRAFTKQLHPYLVSLASQSPEIARGIIQQIPISEPNTSSRKGLAAELAKHLNDPKCKGLYELRDDEKEELRNWKEE